MFLAVFYSGRRSRCRGHEGSAGAREHTGGGQVLANVESLTAAKVKAFEQSAVRCALSRFAEVGSRSPASSAGLPSPIQAIVLQSIESDRHDRAKAAQ